MRLPIAAFGPRPAGRDGLEAACRACEVERMAVRKHGLTSLEKAEMATAQDGCAICGRLVPTQKGWVVDHDRMCCPGEASCPSCRRGILCGWCNSALGYAGDDPARLRRMADYLELGTRLRIGSESDRKPDESAGSHVQDGRTGRTEKAKTRVDHYLAERARMCRGFAHMSPQAPSQARAAHHRGDRP